MTTSTTSRNNFKRISIKILKYLAVAVFWIGLWYIVALAVNQELLLPTPKAVLEVLIKNAATQKFWMAVQNTVIKVLAGFFLAVAAGILLGTVTAKVKFLRTLFAPPLQIIKAAPVASFIILAYVWVKVDRLPVFIAFLTGLPIVWQAVQTAVLNPDKQLEEAADVFGITGARRLFRITAYSAIPAVVSSAVTCLGFCWKSVVATEVISPPLKAALGKSLYNAKTNLETPEVFAYTAVTVILSLLIEILFKTVIKKIEERQGKINAY